MEQVVSLYAEKGGRSVTVFAGELRRCRVRDDRRRLAIRD